MRAPTQVFRVPKRIRSDGSRDVTRALNSFISSLPDHAAVKFAKRGRYRLDGSLMIENHSGLWIKGNGAKLFAGTPGDQYRRHVRVQEGENIVIRNLTIVGANPNAGLSDEAWNPDYEFQHGIHLAGVQGALLDNVRIFDVYGDFIYIAASHPANGVFIPSRNVTIQNSRFKRNGRMGIAVDYAEDVLIQNNYMGQCRRSWVDVEPTGVGWKVYRLTIRNNTVGPHRLNFFANAGRGPNVGNIVISNNSTLPGVTFGSLVISRGDFPGGWEGYRGPYLIEGNVGPQRGGFFVRQANDVTIRSNNMPISRRAAVKLYDANTIRVHDNVFTGATAVYQINDPEPGLSYDYTEWNNIL